MENRRVKVLNFGSLNLDYVYDVPHFVRAEETLSSFGMETFCGGKGLNQSIALARAGACVYHAGAVGGDGGGLTDVLAKNGVDTAHIQVVDGASGHAIIQRDPKGQNCILLHGGANLAIDETYVSHVLADFSQGDYLVLQNEISSLHAILRGAKDRGMHIVLNPAPVNEALHSLPLELVDIFILNEVEAEYLSGTPQPEAMLEGLRRRFPNAAIALTLGKKGVLYQAPQMEAPIRHGIYRVPVVDTTAAGDTFTGFFIACIAKGKSAEIALELASRASSLAVSRKGAEPSVPTMEEVLSADLVLNDETSD